MNLHFFLSQASQCQLFVYCVCYESFSWLRRPETGLLFYIQDRHVHVQEILTHTFPMFYEPNFSVHSVTPFVELTMKSTWPRKKQPYPSSNVFHAALGAQFDGIRSRQSCLLRNCFIPKTLIMEALRITESPSCVHAESLWRTCCISL